MKLDCDIMEAIQRDFNALWKCQQRGNTVEIAVPYLLPNSTLVSLFLTQRGERFIVCDGGGITELLSEYCPLPEVEALTELREMAQKFKVLEGRVDDAPLFFKECSDSKLISSLVFDMASFAVMATSALVASGVEESEKQQSERFEKQAHSYLRTIVPPLTSIDRAEQVPYVPSFRFSAVLRRNSRMWLLSYISGYNLTIFRKNVNDAAKSFAHARSSPLGPLIERTIPVLNNDANGYDPNKLRWQIDELRKDAGGSLVTWTHKEELIPLLSDR